MSLLLLGGFGYGLLAVIFVLLCILLIFMVVITPSQEGGMAAAFGGLGSDSFFGTKANQQINRFTVFLAISFLVLALVLNKINAVEGPSAKGVKKTEQSDIEKDVNKLNPPPGLPDPSRLPPPPPVPPK